MQTKQYHGPFTETLLIDLPNTKRIVQIGIERPLSIPISVYQNKNDRSNSLGAIVTIDDNTYNISENDILEFDGLFQRTATIDFTGSTDEYTIVNVAYKDINE